MEKLDIEWLHFDKDGKTCGRCSETGEALKKTIEGLIRECGPRGVGIVLKETKLGGDELHLSNQIIINGIPIEEILSRAKVLFTTCPSCSDLTGESVCCRAIDINGDNYEAIPADAIRKAVCGVAKCC